MADHEHDDTPGEPPAIRDEAADSPMWLPALGLSLLLLGAIFIVWRSANADETAPVEEAAEAAAADSTADSDEEPAVDPVDDPPNAPE